MTFHENGNSLHGFSWKPNGDRSEETTFSGGMAFRDLLREWAEAERIFVQARFVARKQFDLVRGGQIKEEAQYKNGKFHGRLASFRASGQKTKEVFYLNGLLDGRYEFLTKDGQKYDVGSYRAGKGMAGVLNGLPTAPGWQMKSMTMVNLCLPWSRRPIPPPHTGWRGIVGGGRRIGFFHFVRHEQRRS